MKIWPHFPNVLTLGRILLVPLTIWSLIQGDYRLALALFIAAGITDGVDGFVARRFGLQTELGAYLDPLADKMLLVSIYVTLAALQVLPLWVTILVVTRDVLIVGAVMLARMLDRPFVIQPIFISKVNTVVQIALAAGILASLAFGTLNETILLAATLLMAALTVLSGAVYMSLWLKHMASDSGKDVK